MKFEWDPDKAVANARKHGVTFEQAKKAFADPHAVEMLDEGAGEERWRLLGRADAGVLVVIYTERAKYPHHFGAIGRQARTRGLSCRKLKLPCERLHAALSTLTTRP